MNLNRYLFGLPDRQDAKAWAFCELSGNDIFLGENYLLSPEGEIIKDDFETLREHANYKRKIAGEE